ncbi:hypothetical protein DdX_02620 [Ditylenchus destructor]|uniref:Uncharacterized protein n=1 Tax=Ditylenchus destructor TaxID=166010 RepID=A0AAD4NI37_9BILA|nr:hypothetical protein DdX_02620 [Ditylenchus destructor]
MSRSAIFILFTLGLFLILNTVHSNVVENSNVDKTFLQRLQKRAAPSELSKCFSKFAYDDCENRMNCCRKHQSPACTC